MEYKDLIDLLREEKLTLSSIESLTGGLFAATVTSVPGASDVFAGGMVSYTDRTKELFGIKKDIIENFGAISPECAKEMALVAAEKLDTKCSISFTGNAGPTAQEGKPVGMVFVSIKVKNQVYSYQLDLKGNRDDIRKQCVDFGFEKLVSIITGKENNESFDENQIDDQYEVESEEN